MLKHKAFCQALLVLGALLSFALPAFTAEPGSEYPPASELSDQKPGSVLVFPFYSSAAGNMAQENTRFSITNQNITTSIPIHLFFVNGDSGTVNDTYLCLTPVQTAVFFASDVDPGVRGYAVAVAVGSNGAPIKFNDLRGDAAIKLATGHRASLKAQAIAAITLPAFSGSTATLNFDGVAYNRMPRALALDQIKSRSDGNSTLLVLTRVTGNYAAPNGRDLIGECSGYLYDHTAFGRNFSFTGSKSQLVELVRNDFPLLGFDTFIPAGRSGWFYVAATQDAGLFGAVLNTNSNSGTQPRAFSGGNNLRALSLSSSNSITIPVIPPSC